MGGGLEERFALPVLGWQEVLIGGVFGLLVLVPWVPRTRSAAGRMVALVAAIILTYATLVELTVNAYGPLDLELEASLPLSGALGAVAIAAAVARLAPARASRRLFGLAALGGVIGGGVFVPAVQGSSDELVVVAYLTWQVLVCGALLAGFQESASISRDDP